MDKIQMVSSLIKIGSLGPKESDFHEYPDDLELGFMISMLFTCILTFVLLLYPGLVFWKVQEIFRKWKFYLKK